MTIIKLITSKLSLNRMSLRYPKMFIPIHFNKKRNVFKWLIVFNLFIHFSITRLLKIHLLDIINKCNFRTMEAGKPDWTK